MSLTDATVHTLKPKERTYKHFLGEGLFVQVWPDGRKYWRIKYRFDGRERIYSIGVFPVVSVTAAISTLRLVRAQLDDGIDPAVTKRQAKQLQPQALLKALFRLTLSVDNALTIETDTTLLALTPSQTKALAEFLATNHEYERSTDS
jgi:hypothetical protein